MSLCCFPPEVSQAQELQQEPLGQQLSRFAASSSHKTGQPQIQSTPLWLLASPTAYLGQYNLHYKGPFRENTEESGSEELARYLTNSGITNSWIDNHVKQSMV